MQRKKKVDWKGKKNYFWSCRDYDVMANTKAHSSQPHMINIFHLFTSLFSLLSAISIVQQWDIMQREFELFEDILDISTRMRNVSYQFSDEHIMLSTLPQPKSERFQIFFLISSILWFCVVIYRFFSSLYEWNCSCPPHSLTSKTCPGVGQYYSNFPSTSSRKWRWQFCFHHVGSLYSELSFVSARMKRLSYSKVKVA